MIPKIEIDQEKKRRIMDKAAHLGAGEIGNYGA